MLTWIHSVVSLRSRGLTLRISSGTTCISSHRHCLLVLLHILEIFDCALHLPAIDGLGGLTGVLEGYSEVGAARAGGFGGWELLF